MITMQDACDVVTHDFPVPEGCVGAVHPDRSLTADFGDGLLCVFHGGCVHVGF